MARLIGPDESVRLVYLTSGTDAGKAAAQGLSVPLYADEALTTPADVLSLADGVIAGTPPTLTVDAYSRIPLFKFPADIDIVYTSINGGPAVPLYARTDDRLDALAVAAAGAVQRANHTGTQSADTLTDGTTNKAFLATERTKLTGIATAATANATNAELRDRATHTGTQSADTITGLGDAAADHNLIGWSFDNSGVGAFIALSAAGAAQLIRVPVRYATTVQNVIAYIGTAGSGLTAGQCFGALYTEAGVLIGQTADQAASWAGTGLKTMALAGGPFPVSAGYVYVALWYNGTTSPAFARSGNLLPAFANVGLVAPDLQYATANTGLTTTAPGTLGAQTSSGLMFWAGIS